MPNIQEIYSLQIRTLDDVMTIALQSKARIAEIYATLIEEVLGDTDLDGLTSTSKAALWRAYLFLTAFQLWLHEFLWVKYKVFLDEAATYAQPHTAAWYRPKALEYQHGDTLVVVNGSVVYDPIDAGNRIIAACAVKETASGNLIIKVARLDSGSLVGLESAQLSGFEGYVNQYKDAGVRTSIVSQNADVLNFAADIFYNPGISPIDVFQPALEAAFNAFLASFQTVDFNGTLRLIRLIDALQQVPGFVDIGTIVAQASVAYDVTPNFVLFDREYETIAGYIVVDPNFPLSGTLNYVANV